MRRASARWRSPTRGRRCAWRPTASASPLPGGDRRSTSCLPDSDGRGGRRLAPCESARLLRGEVLRIGALAGSAVAYLAVEGGFDIAPVLGSQSTLIRAAIGGLEGRALRAGDALPLKQSAAAEREEVMLPPLDLSQPAPRPRRARAAGRLLHRRRPAHAAREHLHRLAGLRPHGHAAGGAAAGALGQGLQHRLRRHRAMARSRCRATACRSSCWRTGRRPAAIPRSPPSSPPTSPRSAA